jgi:FdhD protein
MSTSRKVPVTLWSKGKTTHCDDQIATEVPVALTYNRSSHVVMMATPSDLEDFGLGFSLTEGIIDTASDLLSIRVLPRDLGLELAMVIGENCFDRLSVQRRNLTGRTGCGLCGAESLQQAIRPPGRVELRLQASIVALQKAVDELEARQPLQAMTGAVHGAAWCGRDGGILHIREDVGRHNALDKLIGHLCREGFDPSTGFCLVSSRASYEMVYKAAAVGMELLAAVSAPTALAVDFANQSGLTLVGFARPGRLNTYTFSERVS